MDTTYRVFPSGQASVSDVAGDITNVVDNRMALNAPTIIKNSGILNENNLIPVVANAPLSIGRNHVWVKGNICYVNLVIVIPAQVSIPGDPNHPTAFGVKLCSGMPLMPGNTALENDGGLIAVLKYGRAKFNDTLTIGVCQVAGGDLLLGTGGGNLIGSPNAGYTDFLTVSGHYLTNITDSTP